MDYQTLINLGAGTALSIMGWFARELWQAVKDMREDIAKLREELPKTYITKDDFKDGVSEIKQMLIAIDAKLDRKQDK
jgi:predicted  nucleic acid-binding Zn-ribbon protein